LPRMAWTHLQKTHRCMLAAFEDYRGHTSLSRHLLCITFESLISRIRLQNEGEMRISHIWSMTLILWKS
jgi:hypothetical protein